MCSAGSFEAIALIGLARSAVDFVNIFGTKFGVLGAKFRQIAFVTRCSTKCAGRFELTGGKVTAFTCRAGRVGVHGAGDRVTARIITIVRQSTVALFTLLNEPVATVGAIE